MTLDVKYNKLHGSLLTLFCFLLLSLQAFPQTTVTVGSGTLTSQNLPINSNEVYSYSEQIYLQNQINASGDIEKIRFYGSSALTGTRLPVQIFLGHTARTGYGDVPTSWITSNFMTKVFDGYVTPAGEGWMEISFPVPFFYNNTDNLVVAVCDNQPTYESGREYRTFLSGASSGMYYTGNSVEPHPSSPPMVSLAVKTSFLNQIQLVFGSSGSVSAPSDFSASTVSRSAIDLSWNKNASNNNVLIAYSTSNSIGSPVTGITYSAGDPVPDGGTVIYSGADELFSHTGLSPQTRYYYKAWSYDGSLVYSGGVLEDSVTFFDIPYSQDFNTDTYLPLAWGGDANISVLSAHGTSGSNALSKLLWVENSGYGTSPNFGGIIAGSILTFNYRIVNYIDYPATGTPLSLWDKIEVQASVNNGSSYSTIHTINSTNHTTSTGFSTTIINLDAYAGGHVKFRFLMTRWDANYYVDIDNVNVYTPANMNFVSSTTIQASDLYTLPGAVNQEIVYLKIVTADSLNPFNVTSVTFNTSGSTNPATDISGARVYYTGTPVFSDATRFGDAVANPDGSFSVNGSRTLQSGNNYFWLAYDISGAATLNNVVDAACTGFVTSEAKTARTPDVTDPSGSRAIRRPFTGILTIDPDGSGSSNYTSFSAAINELNVFGVGTGGVTYNIAAGKTFNEVAPMSLNVSGTSSDPIVFQKNGAGDNPIVNVIGTAGSSDAAFRLNGCDYVTFNGLDIRDAGTSSANYTEYGFYFSGASATDGCKDNLVKNCSVDLSKANTNSKGIYLNSSASNSSGANSNNKFYNNTVQDCYNGYYFSGSSSAYDNGNEVGTVDGGASLIDNIGGGSSSVYGVYVAYQTGFSVTNTTISNLSSTELLAGIYQGAGSSNTVSYHDNIITALSTSTTPNYSMYGICVTAGTTSAIYSNRIYNLTSAVSSIYGIHLSTGAASIYKNKINNLFHSSTWEYVACGISIGGGTAIDVYNNFIFDIRAWASTFTPAGTVGISVTGGTVNLFFNSVYLNYTAQSSSHKCAALYMSGGITSADIRNNIFISKLTGTPTRAVAFYYNSSVYSKISDNSNNNLYYAGTPGTRFLIFYDGTNSSQTLEQYKTRIATKDANAVSGNVTFISSSDIHINSGVASNITLLKSKGTHIEGFTNDYDNDTRKNPPDIGADEFQLETGTIANNQTTTYLLGGVQAGAIMWFANSGSLPSNVDFSFFRNTIPPGSAPGSKVYQYWVVSNTGGSGFSYDITLYYDESYLNGIPEANLRLAKSEDGGNSYTLYTVEGTGAGQYQLNTTDNWIKVFGLTSFSQFTMTNNDTPLPAELTSFTASVHKGIVTLKWVTATEINNNGFFVESSHGESQEWENLGFVKGNGNSNSPKEYSFIDNLNLNLSLKYRLKQVDNDGSFTYSKEVEIDNLRPSAFDLLQNYPNPFNPTTVISYQISVNSHVTLKLFDVLGKEVATLVNEEKEAGYHNYQLSIVNYQLTSGVYFYELRAGDFVSTKKMILLK